MEAVQFEPIFCRRKSVIFTVVNHALSVPVNIYTWRQDIFIVYILIVCLCRIIHWTSSYVNHGVMNEWLTSSIPPCSLVILLWTRYGCLTRTLLMLNQAVSIKLPKTTWWLWLTLVASFSTMQGTLSINVSVIEIMIVIVTLW